MSPAELAIIVREIDDAILYPLGGRMAELERLKKLVEDHRYDYVEIDRAVQCPCGWGVRGVERADGWKHWTEHLLEASLAAKDI
jgi:hypothetical protein